jgi:hydrogenase-4 membrane subunit HyfE
MKWIIAYCVIGAVFAFFGIKETNKKLSIVTFIGVIVLGMFLWPYFIINAFISCSRYKRKQKQLKYLLSRRKDG